MTNLLYPLRNVEAAIIAMAIEAERAEDGSTRELQAQLHDAKVAIWKAMEALPEGWY